MACALLVELDRRGLRLRVVPADRLDRPAVARGAFVCDDDSPDRVLLRTHAPESDPDCHGTAAGYRIASPRGQIGRGTATRPTLTVLCTVNAVPAARGSKG